MRVLVVSNHTLIGHSLVSMLRNLPPGDPIEAELCDNASVADRARIWGADLILVEAIAEFAAGIASVHAIKDVLPEAHIVVLGTETDEASVYEAINAGAQGYLARETDASALVATLRGVMRGEIGLSRRDAMQVIQQLSRALRLTPTRTATDMHNKLTQREQEVFDLVRRGLRSREIAERLCIAEATVYKHIQHVLDKLQVHSRAQAVFAADFEFPAGLVPPAAARKLPQAPIARSIRGRST